MYDIVIIGAGASGLMCAMHAGKHGRRVAVLDHSPKIGSKILISGGGRCNFTNRDVGPANFVSENPHFCKSALSRYTPEHFIEMMRKHHIPFQERDHGQLFCEVSAQAIVTMLKSECEQAGVEFLLENIITKISHAKTGANRFEIHSNTGTITCQSLVVATGGLSYPKIGASGFGYEIAKQFGLKLVDRAPALDGFTFPPNEREFFSSLAGLAINCVVTTNSSSFRENLLFTHNGLSGPAALQASLYWRPGKQLVINLLPDTNAYELFLAKKRQGNRAFVKNLLAELLPNRFAAAFCEKYFPEAQLPLGQIPDKTLETFCQKLHSWTILPAGTVGYSKAEVTRGGVDTNELSSKTMEAKKVPGLYFIGEVVDVTGWLGGYNLHWAWASGWAAGTSGFNSCTN
jgi:predicted Rossmann fold flavoprotein